MARFDMELGFDRRAHGKRKRQGFLHAAIPDRLNFDRMPSEYSMPPLPGKEVVIVEWRGQAKRACDLGLP